MHPDDPNSVHTGSRSRYNLLSDQDLRDSNRRLQEDNKKLLAECLRLRKLCHQYEGKNINFNKKTEKETSFTVEKTR